MVSKMHTLEWLGLSVHGLQFPPIATDDKSGAPSEGCAAIVATQLVDSAGPLDAEDSLHFCGPYLRAAGVGMESVNVE